MEEVKNNNYNTGQVLCVRNYVSYSGNNNAIIPLLQLEKKKENKNNSVVHPDNGILFSPKKK